tara:strand:+ start:1124 stop:1270 length:147 start_codon:yes stop_codon:yes gene_type:complete
MDNQFTEGNVKPLWPDTDNDTIDNSIGISAVNLDTLIQGNHRAFSSIG